MPRSGDPVGSYGASLASGTGDAGFVSLMGNAGLASSVDNTGGASDGDIGVCLDNIGELDRALASAAQRREAHLYELAEALVHSLPELSLDSLSESYRETVARLTASLCADVSGLLPQRSLRDGINPIGAPELLGIYDRVMLVRGLYRALGESGLASLCPDGLLGARISPTELVRVCYMQNGYSDLAAEFFTPYLCTAQDGLSRVFSDSPEQACGEVEQGSAQYCILPIEDLSEGRLSGAERLIRRYDLHIAMSVSLMPRGMVFALLRRSCCRIGTAGDGALSYELHSDESGIGTEQIIAAARLLGLPLRRADSRHAEYDTSRLLHSLRFGVPEGGERGAELLGLLLRLEKRDYAPVGFYRSAERDISGAL